MSKPTDSALWRSILFLFCASLVACQSAFGDYKAGVAVGGSMAAVGGSKNAGGKTSTAGTSSKAGNTSTAGGSSNGGNTATNACSSDGIYRCTDTSIETCVNRQWQATLSCSRDLCDSDRGRCMICAPGANRCSAYNLQTCASTGDSWTTTDRCDTAEYCDSLSNTCFACLPGEAFCDGAALYRCNAKKNGWDVLQCDSPDSCDARAQSCGEVCPNSDWVSCNGASLIGCDGNGHHVQLDSCASSQLCEQTLKDRASNPAGWSGKCSAGCTPETYQCNPAKPSELRACPPSGLKWEHVEDCPTAELCDAAGQRCKPGCGVPPGTVVCDGAQLERCLDDGTGFEVLKTCADPDHCNAQKNDCVACVPGESRCNGAILQTCKDDQTWNTATTCASAALCDAKNGLCVDPGCTRAGSFQCAGATLQQCAADLTTWKDVAVCTTSTLCDASNGRCNPIECEYPGAYRCQGRSVRQQCDEPTRRWLDANTCKSDETCDLSSPTGCSASCPEIPARCNTVGSQTDAQICTMVNGRPVWSTVASCATAALCNAGEAGASCTPPICQPNEYSCDGTTLRRCKTGRNGWDVSLRCDAGEICDAVGGQCDVCTPNTYTCDRTTSTPRVLKCTTDGQFNNVVDNCSATDCYASSDKSTGYCYRCNAGDAQCAGTTQIQTCAADRRGWATATACANGCQDNPGNSDYCAACPVAGEIQCVESGVPGSTRTCASDRKSWGATTTCSKGYGCVDNGTADYCADACSPSAAECVSTTSRHVCAADGKGWGTTISECASSTSLRACAGGQFNGTSACPSANPFCVNGQCVECTGSTVECSGSNSLRTCSNGKWVASTCPSSAPICAGNACVACTSGSSSTCTSSTTRQYCAANNTWATSTCSGTTPYCQGGNCVECTSSTAATCASNNTVQSCSKDGKYVTTTCSGATPVCHATASGALCAACNANTPPECLPDGITRRTCVNGAFAELRCEGANTTYCLNGACAGCNANSPARCTSNNTLSTCNTANGSWVEQTCPAAAPICAGSPGKCVECSPDSGWVCTGSNTRHSCVNSMNVDETCTAGQICDPADKTCKAPTCAANEQRCSGNVLQKCNGTRTGWDDLQTCAAACYSGACVMCAPGSSECVGDTGIRTCAANGSGYGDTRTECADGGSLKTCSGGVFSGSTPCPANAPICSNGQCIAAQCDVGQRRCSEGVPQICNSARTGWDTLPACSGATPVCQPSTGTCGCSQTSECAAIAGAVCYGGQCVTAACNDGQFQCVNNQLQKCNATRTGWDEVATCIGTTPVCQASTGTCGCSTSTDCAGTPATPICSGNKCIAPVCSVGQTQCSGNVSQICNPTQTGWTDVTTCAGITPICQPSTGQCGCSRSEDCAGTSATPICSNGTCVAPTCSAGQHQCQGNVQQVCNETRTGWTNEAACSGTTPKCLTATGMCGCSESSDCGGSTPVCTGGVCVASTTTDTATTTATATATTTTTTTATDTATTTTTATATATATMTTGTTAAATMTAATP